MKLPCCGHLKSRHWKLDDDDPQSPVFCLTGACRCGKPEQKPKAAKVIKPRGGSPEYRRYPKKQRVVEDDDL